MNGKQIGPKEDLKISILLIINNIVFLQLSFATIH